MRRQLDDSDFAVGVRSGDFEFPGAEFVRICRIHTVIAAECLDDFCLPIHLVRQCAWHDLDGLHLADQ